MRSKQCVKGAKSVKSDNRFIDTLLVVPTIATPLSVVETNIPTVSHPCRQLLIMCTFNRAEIGFHTLLRLLHTTTTMELAIVNYL